MIQQLQANLFLIVRCAFFSLIRQILDAQVAVNQSTRLNFQGKENEKPIKLSHIYALQEINMQMMDATEGGVLQAVEKMLAEVFIPALKANKAGWGELAKSQNGEEIRNKFLGNLESFVGVLSGARESLSEKVILEVKQ